MCVLDRHKMETITCNEKCSISHSYIPGSVVEVKISDVTCNTLECTYGIKMTCMTFMSRHICFYDIYVLFLASEVKENLRLYKAAAANIPEIITEHRMSLRMIRYIICDLIYDVYNRL